MSASSRNDQRTILAAMPWGQPVTSAEIAAQVGMNSISVGSLLRNACRAGVVSRAGSRCEKRGLRWYMVPLWRRTDPQPRAPETGLDDEDRQWMAYWKQRRRARLQRQSSSRVGGPA